MLVAVSAEEWAEQVKIICESGSQTAYICDHSVAKTSEVSYPRLEISHNCEQKSIKTSIDGSTYLDRVEQALEDDNSPRRIGGLAKMRLYSYTCGSGERVKIVKKTSPSQSSNLCSCPSAREAVVMQIVQRFT